MRLDPSSMPDQLNRISQPAEGVMVVDSQWRVTYANLAAAHFLNWALPEELIGTLFLKAFPGGQGKKLQQVGKRAISKKILLTTQFYSEDNSRWYECRFYPIPDRLIVLIIEIPSSVPAGSGGDRSTAELHTGSAAWRGSFDDLQALPDKASKALIALNQASQKMQQVISPELLAQEIIEVLENLLDYTNSAVLLIDETDGKTLVPFALSTQKQGSEFLKKDKEYVESKKPQVGVGITGWVAQHGKCLRVGNVLEDPRYFSMRADIRSELCVPIISDDRVIGVINVETTQENAYSQADELILETVAAQISVSIQRAQLIEKLRKEFSDYEQMLAWLTQSVKNPAIGQLTAAVAHEFNNPLQSMKGFLSLYHQEVMEGQSKEKLEQYFKIVYEELERISRMIRNLRDFSRPASKGFFQVDINALINSVLALTEKQCQDRGIDVVPTLTKSLQPVIADADQIKQLLFNLVLNAIDAMETGGSLLISTFALKPNADRTTPMLEIKITDTGRGMSQFMLDHVFDPFFTTKEKGTGLGLYICQQIVNTHGGKIAITSKINAGTTVRVQLPMLTKEKTP